MPFSIVLTSEGSSQFISVVPSTWINEDSVLFWPRAKKTSDLEMLRRNEKSIPSQNWKKLKCKIKLHGISTFAEGLKLEELYANFDDTEDEERYHKNREHNRKHPAIPLIGENLLDLNSDFEQKSNEPTATTSFEPTEQPVFVVHASTDASKIKTTNEEETVNQNNENLISINLNEFNDIITLNNELQAENKNLKETVQRLQNLEKETQKGFATIQIQLDKLFDLLSPKCQKFGIESDANGYNKIDMDFPINTVQQLNLLEDQLIDQEFEKALITKFTKICGTSGTMKISKIGLHLTKCLFTDELLYNLSWKGIKGCSKVPFINYIKTRGLFFKIVQLADSSCSEKDSDAFLQNSAIKHSGQRIKRKSTEAKTTSSKKKKIETEKKTDTENEEVFSPNNLKDSLNLVNDMQEEEEINKENVELSKSTKKQESEMHDEEKENDGIPETRNSSNEMPQKVTILSDVKITNKMLDLKHETKMMNISYDNLLVTEVFKEDAELK